MTTIDPGSSRFTAVSVLDVSDQREESALAVVCDHAEDRARSQVGLVSATVLRRRPPTPGAASEEPVTRLLTYGQWESAASYHQACEVRGTSPSFPGAIRAQTDGYELDAVVARAGRLDIIAPDSRLTLLVFMDPLDGVEARLNEYNQQETREFFRGFNGFVGAAFHLGPSGRVFEYLQWESAPAMEVATSTHRFRAHLKANAELCHGVDFSTSEVALTVPGPGR